MNDDKYRHVPSLPHFSSYAVNALAPSQSSVRLCSDTATPLHSTPLHSTPLHSASQPAQLELPLAFTNGNQHTFPPSYWIPFKHVHLNTLALPRGIPYPPNTKQHPRHRFFFFFFLPPYAPVSRRYRLFLGLSEAGRKEEGS